MRIKVIGDCDSVLTLRNYLRILGYANVKKAPDFTIYLDEDDSLSGFVKVDGIDSELERFIVLRLEELGIGRFLLERAGGIRSDREIRISFHPDSAAIVERGISRGLDATIRSMRPMRRSISAAIMSIFSL